MFVVISTQLAYFVDLNEQKEIILDFSSYWLVVLGAAEYPGYKFSVYTFHP